MRTITTHHTNDANRELRLYADNRNPENGNASHFYKIYYDSGALAAAAEELPYSLQQTLQFQNGPIGEVGVNGITNEVLLAIVIDRLEGFQTSKWANTYNEHALSLCRAALQHLELRTKEREARGVEGTHTV
jgi:hypothetical protein